jgi:Tripartite tricarboxylate transporter TctB family
VAAVLTTDRVAGAGLVLVALLALVDSRGLPLGTLRNPGPAYVPVLLAGGLLVLGALIAATGGRAARVGDVGWGEWRHALAIVAVCVFAAWGLERLGYRLTVTLSLVVLLGLVERKGPVVTVGVALGLAFGTFHLFATLLRTPLPRGPFGL